MERHANPGKAIDLGREPIERKWFASYNSLVPEVRVRLYGESLRTMPGKLAPPNCSRSSRGGTTSVELRKKKLHRITLWLDCTSVFYGVYEEGGEAFRGEIVGRRRK